MKSRNKLFELLATFDQKEWLEFGKYLRSPFFNQTDSLVRLADILAPYFKDGPIWEELPSKEMLFHSACPDRAFSELDYNRLCSRLLTLASDYLALQSWQSDGIMHSYYALKVYQERDLDKHFRFDIQKAQRSLKEEPVRNIRFYYQQYLLARAEELYWSKDKKRSLGEQVQEAADHFDSYFVAQKLRHLCSLISLNKVRPESFQVHFAEQIMTIAEHLPHIPIISIYRRLYLLLTHTQPDRYFFELKDQLPLMEDTLSDKELYFIYLTLVNFCIRGIRAGKKEFANPLLFLYEQALDKGLFLDKGVISPWTFKNVIKLGLGLHRYDWVKDFIHQYGPLLNETERTEAIHFNLADLYYHQGAYEQAQLQLREVEFSDLRYYLHGRILLAKIYYTTEAWEALDSLLSSFKVYILRNKKMSRDEKRAYQNFIRLLDKLLRSLPEKRRKIREQIQQTVLLTDRSWLLEVAD
ncbi:MAG: hypothetical protein R2824_32005 [Saprospiraceae bacterium]|nr:hypothetical protein [Lewinella sp.]